MTAVLVPATTEAEWLAARRQGITASEIAVVMGLSPWSSPYELYYRKTGDLPEQPDSDAMALGRHMESWVADQFHQRHPEFWLSGNGRELYASSDRPWQMATPDRLICDLSSMSVTPLPLAVLECKVDNGDGFGDDGSDEIPVHYRCQVLWQMDVLGVTTGFLACLIWHRRQVRVYELTLGWAEQSDLDLMHIEATLFLDRIKRGDPPEVDWRPATTSALKRLHPSVIDIDVPVRRMPIIQYQAACKAYEAAEQRKKLAENRLRQLLGSGHRITSAHTGEVIARRDVYDVKEHVRKASHVDKLVPVKPKDGTP